MIIAEYTAPVDIMNRALQHLGAIRGALGDGSKEMTEAAFLYDKVRKAELRRNCWVFATRHTVVRPLATTDMTFTALAWASGTTYLIGDLVSQDGEIWQNMIASSHGIVPDTQQSSWQLYYGPSCMTLFDNTGGTSYFAGELVYDSTQSNKPYVSLMSGNTDTTFNVANWTAITGATLSPVQIIYPIGSGPASQTAFSNVFFVPVGYLRLAPQNPKQGSQSYLGQPSELPYNDYVFEGPYFTSAETAPISLRFVADITDVSQFDDMFCEGLAARLAMELCQPLTQSSEKFQEVLGSYGRTMGEARLVNAIESQSTYPPMDEYIACRA